MGLRRPCLRMEEARFDALDHRLRALEGRLRAVEARLSAPASPQAEPLPGPVPAPEVEPLRERLQSLGERVYALEAHAPARMAEALLRVEARLVELERTNSPPEPPSAERRRRGLRLL